MTTSNAPGSVRGKGLAGEGKAVEGTFVKRKVERDGGAWSISVVKVGDRERTAVGPMLDPRPGAKIRLLGAEEKSHPTYGPQIVFRSYEWIGWADLRGVEDYLVETCDGIGRKTAKKLVDKYGEEAVVAVREKTAEVETFLGFDAGALADSKLRLDRDAKYERLQFLLRGAGFGPGRIGRLLATYGDEALEVLQSDPWRVSIEVDGFGFISADQIALALGHPATSPSRGRAALAHVVREASQRDGHIWLPREFVVEEIRKLGIPQEAIDPALVWADENGYSGKINPSNAEVDKAIKEASKIGVEISRADFVDAAGGIDDSPSDRLADPKLFEADTTAAFQIVNDFLSGAPGVAWDDERLSVVRLDEFQKEAIETLRKNRLVVVTGGPGTGKTHMLKAVWTALGGAQNVRILAPTGKAAARIRESGLEASTIHRALGFGIDDEKRNAGGERIGEPVVIVDESSMVDSSLFSRLLSRLPAGGSLWLFGDADQLPPVGPGSPFADLIASGVVPVARLRKIHRVDESSWLAENAKRVNAGERPVWGVFKKGDGSEGKIEDFFFGEAPTADEAEALIVDLVARRIPAKFRVSVDDIQVLSPKNKDAAGVESLNEAIRRVVNPTGEEAFRFRVGDRLIHTRNNYELGVMNGEIGKAVAVRFVENPRGKLEPVLDVDFSDRVASYDEESAKDLRLAYAITVHKSQGSQFPVVVVPVLKSHAWMLSRRLLYTGISRARKIAVLVGEEAAVGLSVKNVRSANRNTYLREILEKSRANAERGSAV